MSFVEVIGFGLTMIAYHVGVIAVLLIPVAVIDPKAFARPFRNHERNRRRRLGLWL